MVEVFEKLAKLGLAMIKLIIIPLGLLFQILVYLFRLILKGAQKGIIFSISILFIILIIFILFKYVFSI